MAGQNLSNTHDNAAEYQISPANVGTLKPKWVLTTAGDVTATPTECGGTVYVPDLGGKLWAVNAQTGAVRWSHAVSGYTGIAGDASRTSPAVYGNELIAGDGYLMSPGVSCGPDWDLSSAANLFTTTSPATGQPEQLLGIGQKSGVYWAVNPANGHVAWQTQVGPGGIEWGSATDGTRIYVAESNSQHQPYTLAGSGPYAGQTTTNGFWSALNAATGKILWQTPDPQDRCAVMADGDAPAAEPV